MTVIYTYTHIHSFFNFFSYLNRVITEDWLEFPVPHCSFLLRFTISYLFCIQLCVSVNHHIPLLICIYLLLVSLLACSDGKESASNIWSLGQEDFLEKEMATHSGVLAGRIPWTLEPGRLQFIESQIVGWLKRLSMHSLLSSLSASCTTSLPHSFFFLFCIYNIDVLQILLSLPLFWTRAIFFDNLTPVALLVSVNDS